MTLRLQPHIDALTMHLHVAKHHTAYVANLNAAIAAHPALAALPLSPAALCRMLGPSAGACAGGAKECLTLEPVEAELLRRSAGGHWNHSLFFSTMAAEPEFRGPTSAELNAAISASFGSMDGLMEAFGRAAAGRFGSGWVWLGVKPDGQLAITSTANEVRNKGAAGLRTLYLVTPA
jgi:Fe-Mn family superoxide dismutase